MSSADKERARLSLARGGGRWVRHDKHEVDVEMLEDRVKDFRWCAYTKNFVHISTFSNEQRAKPANKRFSQTYSNHQKRASMNPSIEMTDEEHPMDSSKEGFVPSLAWPWSKAMGLARNFLRRTLS